MEKCISIGEKQAVHSILCPTKCFGHEESSAVPPASNSYFSLCVSNTFFSKYLNIMSFGFSVGGFVAVGSVIADVISCLEDSTGSKSDYQELVRELEPLDRALKSLDKLKPIGSSPTAVDSIKCAALSCRVPLEQFLNKIHKYEPTLGPQVSSSSIASSSKAAIRKIKWLSKADDIDRLRKYFDVHLGTINILLLEHGLQALDVTSRGDARGMRQYPGLATRNRSGGDFDSSQRRKPERTSSDNP